MPSGVSSFCQITIPRANIRRNSPIVPPRPRSCIRRTAERQRRDPEIWVSFGPRPVTGQLHWTRMVVAAVAMCNTTVTSGALPACRGQGNDLETTSESVCMRHTRTLPCGYGVVAMGFSSCIPPQVSSRPLDHKTAMGVCFSQP